MKPKAPVGSRKGKFNASVALTIAIDCKMKLLASCHFITQCEIAGSLRRRRSMIVSGGNTHLEVHDIDIVCAVTIGYEEATIKSILELSDYEESLGSKRSSCTITYQGFPVDVDITTPVRFPSLLMKATGSKQENIRLAVKAMKLGYKFGEDGLVDRASKAVIARTDEEVYLALGEPFKQIWER